MSGWWLLVREERADAGQVAGHRRCVEDAAGDGTTFAYDVDNPLVPVEDAAGAVTTSAYNALQQRVGRDVASMPATLPRGAQWLSSLPQVELSPLVRLGEDGGSADCMVAVRELQALAAQPHRLDADAQPVQLRVPRLHLQLSRSRPLVGCGETGRERDSSSGTAVKSRLE